MTKPKLNATLAEMKRLRDRIDTLLEAMSKYDSAEKPGPYSYFNGPALTGAVRRASLDLTRALAALRDCRR